MCVIPNPQKISLKITDPLDISPILRYLATHEDPDVPSVRTVTLSVQRKKRMSDLKIAERKDSGVVHKMSAAS